MEEEEIKWMRVSLGSSLASEGFFFFFFLFFLFDVWEAQSCLGDPK